MDMKSREAILRVINRYGNLIPENLKMSVDHEVVEELINAGHMDRDDEPKYVEEHTEEAQEREEEWIESTTVASLDTTEVARSKSKSARKKPAKRPKKQTPGDRVQKRVQQDMKTKGRTGSMTRIDELHQEGKVATERDVTFREGDEPLVKTPQRPSHTSTRND